MFYPDNKADLESTVTQMLGSKSGFLDKSLSDVPKALIVPHAGFRYSGDIAASGYAMLRSGKSKITRVILIGPAHRVRVEGVAASGAQSFMTPFGEIPVDTLTVKQCVRKFSFIKVNNSAHQAEHSLETQLPFLQKTLENFPLCHWL